MTVPNTNSNSYSFATVKEKVLHRHEIVPACWLSWDDIKETCVTKYPSPPYNAKICMQLQRLVETEQSPLETWPFWEIKIRGGADTYAGPSTEAQEEAISSTDTVVTQRELECLNVRFAAMVGNGDDTVQHSPEVTIEQVNKDYELNLPCDSLANYQAFNTKLQKDKNLKRKWKSSLEQLRDPESVTRSVRNILQEFLMPELAINICALKKSSKSTILLRNTNFGNCMIGVLISFHENDEGDFINAGDVDDATKKAFTKANDWTGPRRRTVQE